MTLSQRGSGGSSASASQAGGHSGAPAYTVDLQFDNLSFTVTDRATHAPKRILHDVSGGCRAGRLTAIMGPSGGWMRGCLRIVLHARDWGLCSWQPRAALLLTSRNCLVAAAAAAATCGAPSPQAPASLPW